jgi:hypothetical protein
MAAALVAGTTAAASASGVSRGDRDETELQWCLVHRAELFYVHRTSDRLRRIAYNNSLRTRGL